MKQREVNSTMKSFMKEFKEFISRGNVMDMAVGIIIGGAFTAIVTSLVNDILMPLIAGIFGGLDFSSWVLKIGESSINIGTFVAALVNFLIVAFVIFSIIKAMNKAASIVKKPEEEAPAAPTTKICPYCKSEINIEATRCPACTSLLETEQ